MADEVREGLDTEHFLYPAIAIPGFIDAEPILDDIDSETVLDLDGGDGYVDKDWYRVTLDRNHVYEFFGTSGTVSTGELFIRLYDENGKEIPGFIMANGGIYDVTASESRG